MKVSRKLVLYTPTVPKTWRRELGVSVSARALAWHVPKQNNKPKPNIIYQLIKQTK